MLKNRFIILLQTLIGTLLVCLCQPAISQTAKLDQKRAAKTKTPRLERKAIRYEALIKKKKAEGARLLDDKVINYTKVKKVKTEIENLSIKAEKCRYRLKSKRHIKIQDKATKKRMKKSLRTHRRYKANRRWR
ncbi:MAG TPA: hypothetical protein VFV37_10245 [Luteibaculaceae bacterium]|nr:hypothetical protein [Luteibaculaceae bacterium]